MHALRKFHIGKSFTPIKKQRRIIKIFFYGKDTHISHLKSLFFSKALYLYVTYRLRILRHNGAAITTINFRGPTLLQAYTSLLHVMTVSLWQDVRPRLPPLP